MLLSPTNYFIVFIDYFLLKIFVDIGQCQQNTESNNNNNNNNGYF